MIRTLEAACNNNILHPVLLHKPLDRKSVV